MIDDLTIQRALYPRVTEIISKQNGHELRSIPIEVLTKAQIRGQTVHEYCTAHVNHLWIPEIDPQYALYFHSFVQWAEEHIEENMHAAVRLYDDEKKFTGEFDLLVKLRTGKRALIDIKTSFSSSKAWPLQLAAYAHLCRKNGHEFDEAFVLHIRKIRGARLEEVEGKEVEVDPPLIKVSTIHYQNLDHYWDIFHSALKCFYYFEGKDIKNNLQ